MKKFNTNFLIDSVMFITMLAIIGIGLLMKYILIPGSERWIKYGMNVDLTLLGLDRHGWGEIHLILGFILIGLLTLHTILHWRTILSMFKKFVKNDNIRLYTGIIFLLVSLFLITAPFVLNIKVDKMETGRNSLHRDNASMIILPSDSNTTQVISSDDKGAIIEKKPSYRNHSRQNEAKHREHELHQTYYIGTLEIEVKGYMTINEVSDKYDIPANYLKNKLNLPLSTSNNETLGRLRRVYGFKMHEIENIINLYNKAKENKDEE